MNAVFVSFFALLAVTSAGVLLPQTYSLGWAGAPLAATPLAASLVSPISPLALSAPIAVAAPVAAIQSGYVAATRGSIHTAPLPEGPWAASHHINTAPAPGTL